MTEPVLREWLANALAECCDGEVSARRILDADCTLAALGIGSLALVRLIDAVENELEVILDLDDDSWFRDLDSMTAYLSGHVSPDAGR
ncbi:hypothetical protein GCM10009839_06840 [Catenulispora yoronensis]|uniref:Carrier domain-containing protein n=1 Tax=Catenulispora yoronensis TaxID=450799 RepID=A0ABN2TMK8_9ACTN